MTTGISESGGWDDDSHWEPLLTAIEDEYCTPFLGAGACAGVLPLAKQIAKDWAEKHKYPFADSENLSRVSQYVSVATDSLSLRAILKKMFGGKLPDFDNLNEPHRVLAELDFSVYITTNYDNFMVEALKRQGKNPDQRCCQWHKARGTSRSKESGRSAINPTADAPVVYHLHGYLHDPLSMVLTENDYLDFLINTSVEKVIEERIQEAFGPDKVFLFIGYSLEDMSFKVLFRKFAKQMRQGLGARHVSVQLPNENLTETQELTEEQKRNQRAYLQKLLGSQEVRIYWGKAEQFAEQLRTRWEEFKRGT